MELFELVMADCRIASDRDASMRQLQLLADENPDLSFGLRQYIAVAGQNPKDRNYSIRVFRYQVRISG